MQISVSRVLEPVAYTILVLGSTYALKGVLKMADLGYDFFHYCRNKQNEHYYVNEDLFREPPSKWKKGVKVFSSLLDTAQNFGNAALITFVGITFLEVSKDLTQTQGSSGLNVKFL